MNSESKSDAYYLKTEDGGVARTYCHMENIQGCGGGGWTLVMKIDVQRYHFAPIGSINNDLKIYICAIVAISRLSHLV